MLDLTSPLPPGPLPLSAAERGRGLGDGVRSALTAVYVNLTLSSYNGWSKPMRGSCRPGTGLAGWSRRLTSGESAWKMCWPLTDSTMFDSTSPLPPGPLPFPNSEFGGEEKGEKRWGFEVGGAHLKTPIPPSPRAAQRGGGQGGGAGRCHAPRAPNASGKKISCTWRQGSLAQRNACPAWPDRECL